MTTNLPAYRYELFIKAFEKKVTAAQQAIDRLRKMEAPYNLVKAVMEAERLPNEQQIFMETGSITVFITATREDSLEAFEAVAARLGQRLLKAGMHKDGVPATSHGGGVPCLWFRWFCGPFDIKIFASVPVNGMRDVEVTETERRTVQTEYVLKRIEPKTCPVPSNFRTGPQEMPF